MASETDGPALKADDLEKLTARILEESTEQIRKAVQRAAGRGEYYHTLDSTGMSYDTFLKAAMAVASEMKGLGVVLDVVIHSHRCRWEPGSGRSTVFSMSPDTNREGHWVESGRVLFKLDPESRKANPENRT